MGVCKCGKELAGRRRVYDDCRAATVRKAVKRWRGKQVAEKRAAYEAAPKRCQVCGAALPWKKRNDVYCGDVCAYEMKKQRAKRYHAHKQKQTPQKSEQKTSKAPQGKTKTATLRQVVQLLEEENEARRVRGEDPLSYGKFVQQKEL